MSQIIESNETDTTASLCPSDAFAQAVPKSLPTESRVQDEEDCGKNEDISARLTRVSRGSLDISQDKCFHQEASEPRAKERGQDLEDQKSTNESCLYSIFSLGMKRYVVFMVAVAGFFSPLSGNIYFPALNTISRELHVSKELVNLTLTSYSIFQGLAPTVFGDLADMAGRRPAFITGFVIYIAACIGIALQHSYPALFILRCFQSTGSSSTIALGSGVVADIATAAERGTWMGWAQIGPMIGPAVGPLVGGILSQFLGWRSIFWFLAILGSVYLAAFAITVPETGRNVVGNGSIPPQGWNLSLLNYLAVRKAASSTINNNSPTDPHRSRAELAQARRLRWPNPLNTLKLLAEPDVRLLILLNALIYTAFINVLASLPYLLAATYHFNDLQIGLSFLPFGIGGLVAPLVNGRLLDANYRRIAQQVGMRVDARRGDGDLSTFPLERARIEVAAPQLLLGVAALAAYGWVMQAQTQLAWPLVLLFVMGVALTGAFNVLNVLLVDLYPLAPATATAALNLTRCLFSAVGSAVIIFLIEAMGRGWCFTGQAVLVAVVSPVLAVLVRRGPEWREKRRIREEERKGGREGKRRCR